MQAEHDMYQFGFKSGHSTTLCTDVLKKVIKYYSTRGSHVFACFIDLFKAFDKVNYWKLFHKLLNDNLRYRSVLLLCLLFGIAIKKFVCAGKTLCQVYLP
jgi:hypothetical protein